MLRGRVKPDSGLILRDKPNGRRKSALPHNLEFTITESVTYYRVRTDAGEVGYVHGDYVEKLPQVSEVASPANGQDAQSAFKPVNFNDDALLGDAVRIDSDFAPHLARIVSYARECGVRLWITSSLRQLDKQVKGAIVRPATHSCHHVGHAIDMNVMFEDALYNSKRLQKSNHHRLPPPVLDFINLLRDDEVLRWGGDFRQEDPVHIDDDFFRQNEALFMAKLDDRVLQSNPPISRTNHA